MAITRLMHMKEAPNYKPQHLVNAINYILDVRNYGAKTDYGKWVGGNSGTEAQNIINTFLNTKANLNKESGRQGYHFVISFPPGETDAQTCYNVLQDFCEEYLGDNYDYVFAVHTDQEHMHGHIVFNSISRTTGYKYRYEKGDWEKTIQPITDKVTQKYGLNPLTIEKEKVGMSYASWAEAHLGQLNWKHIIRADIDLAIQKSSNIEDFFSYMKQLNYDLDFRGFSKKYNSRYITFIYTDDMGVKHKHRSYSLTKGESDDYNLATISERIKSKGNEKPYYEELSDVLHQKVNVRLGQMSSVMKNTQTYRRMYQAVSFYKLPNPFAEPQGTVRRDMLRLEKLIEDCAYLKRNPELNAATLETRQKTVSARLKDLYNLKSHLEEIEKNVASEALPSDINRYRQLQHVLDNTKEFDDSWEAAEDEMEALEKNLPTAWVDNEKKLHHCKYNIEILKREKKILGRLIATEGGNKVLSKELQIIPGKKQ